MRKLLTGLLARPVISAALVKDLKRLDKLQAGLGSKVLGYVTKGTDEIVLSTLGNVDAAKALGLNDRYGGAEESRARAQYFARACTDPAAAARFAQVLDVIKGVETDHLAGSKGMATGLRAYFTCLLYTSDAADTSRV